MKDSANVARAMRQYPIKLTLKKSIKLFILNHCRKFTCNYYFCKNKERTENDKLMRLYEEGEERLAKDFSIENIARKVKEF